MNRGLSVFAIYLVILISSLGLIKQTFSLTSSIFILEFLILLAYFFVLLISLVGLQHKFNWAWRLLMVVLLAALLNMLLMNNVLNAQLDMFILYTTATLVGFFIALFNLHSKAKKTKKRPAKKNIKTVAKKSSKKINSGKLVGSKFGKTIHAPKCEWANKIKKSNKVWFRSVDEAKRAKYKPHECVSK